MRTAGLAIAKAFHLLNSRERRRWALLVPLSATVAGLEAIGTLFVVELLQLMTDPAARTKASAYGELQAMLPDRSDAELLLVYSIVVGVLFASKNVVRAFEVFARQLCSANSIVVISQKLLRSYLYASYDFHLRRNSSLQIRNMQNVSTTICDDILMSGATAMSESLVVACILVVVASSLPKADVVIGAGLLLALSLGLLLMQRQQKRWGQRSHALRATLLKALRQGLDSVREVKIVRNRAFFEQGYIDDLRRVNRLNILRRTAEKIPRLVVETLFIVALISLMLLSNSAGNTEAIPLLGLFAYAGLRTLPALQTMVSSLSRLRWGAAAIDSIHNDWQTLERQRSATRTHRTPIQLRHLITFEGIDYTYPNAKVPVLDNFELRIKRGDYVGIVGRTGAGKTTLIDLFLGLLHPTLGRITIDGESLRKQTDAWQRQVGYVPQVTYLIDDTVRRNVAFSLNDSEIDDDRIWAVARIAQLEDFLNHLPKKLDTLIGENGTWLSAGQRQRLAIARAIYFDPEVLIFDEATANLDVRTERDFNRAIASLKGEKTVIVVSHRLSIIEHCDYIVYLRTGQISEVGTYEKLFNLSDSFRELMVGARAEQVPAD